MADLTTISVDRETFALVEDYRLKGESKADAIRRAIGIARHAQGDSFRASA